METGRETASLPVDFYARDAETVARALLGQTLVHRCGGVGRDGMGYDGVTLRARIVETEAYVGVHDLACHAAKGRTQRTEVMYGPPGHAYVYLIYGMYELLNIVTGADGEAQAVLIRAVEAAPHLGKTDGPGKLTRALGITRAYHGRPVTAGVLTLEPGPSPRRVVVTPRIGVAYAGVWKDAPLRFYDPDSGAVSRRSVRATAAT